MSPASPRAVEPRLGQRDLLAILAVVALCLALRVPALDRIALNPDESQYEATAAYLLASGSSAFELPYTTAGTYVLYTTVARWFGPFAMLPVRLLVLAISLALGLMVYLACRRVTAPWAALVGALVAVHYAIPFEGYTANREWFSLLPLMAAALVVQLSASASKRGRTFGLLAAGALAGGALWFKAQALPIVLAIPLFLVLQALADRRVRLVVRELAAYGSGAAASLAVYLAGFFLAGSLGSLAATTVEGWGTVRDNELASSSGIGATLRLWLDRLFLEVEFRPLLLIAYFLALLSVVALLGARRREPPWVALPEAHRRAGLLYGSVLLGSLIAVKTGSLFFGHYYLFLVPPVAIFVALALDALAGRSSGTRRTAAAVLVGLLVVDRVLFLGAADLSALWDDLPRQVPFAIYVCVLAAVALTWLFRPLRAAGFALLVFCVVELGLLVVQTQLAPCPPSLPYHPDRFDRLATEISARQRTGDRIFVWGWLPEIYSRVRLEPASLLILGQYVVTDYEKASTESQIDSSMADRLMQDLEERRPRFIVDAWKRSWTIDSSGEPWIYDLRRYPEFALNTLLREHYRRVGTFSECDLYEFDSPAKVDGSVIR